MTIQPRNGRNPRPFNDPNDDIGSNPTANRSFAEVLEARLSRRDALKGLMATTALTAGAAIAGRLGIGAAEAAASTTTLTFAELAHGVDENMHVADGYGAEVLIRWGDPMFTDSPEWDPANQTAAAQEKQFGYNADYVGYFPLPMGSTIPDHGIMVVNHEYTNTNLMFPGLGVEGYEDKVTAEQVEIELAAHGASVIEVRRESGKWTYVKDSPYNRRITLRSTEMLVSGPAAGHDRLKTSADATGTKVIGTINNCAGGKTPWGTVLIAEENFHQYFSGDPAGLPDEKLYKRLGIKGEPEYGWWGKHVARFDVTKEPNEPNRFGWMIEFDPYDVNSTPVKRTALGRFKHEGANTTVNPDGRVVVYTGDDERFEYLYRFVSAGTFDANNRDANGNLLDEGTLSVAKFNDDGTLTWLNLVFGEGPLTAENGFASQADVVIEARRASDLLGATPMDRPEDVEPNPVTNVVYLALTNNSNRLAADDPEAKPGKTPDAANPRAKNSFGHILAMTPPGAPGANADHAAETFTWDIPILAGDPKNPDHGAKYNPDTTANGWFAAPDNVAFDSTGRLWIATDNGGNWTKVGFADGIYGCDVDGKGAYLTKHIFHVPIGAEMCGPEFTPDDQTLFCAVQHPASDGVENSTFDTPATRWPDFKDGVPPRAAVVFITKNGGGVIGT
jgi:hypothetical protein